jgi:hypothetical protein
VQVSVFSGRPQVLCRCVDVLKGRSLTKVEEGRFVSTYVSDFLGDI